MCRRSGIPSPTKSGTWLRAGHAVINSNYKNPRLESRGYRRFHTNNYITIAEVFQPRIIMSLHPLEMLMPNRKPLLPFVLSMPKTR